MKKKIKELYDLRVQYVNEIVPQSEKYKKLQDESENLERKFRECLNAEQNELFTKFIEIGYEIASLENECNFEEGFSEGVSLTAESFVKY